jgi:hypothetical protein
MAPLLLGLPIRESRPDNPFSRFPEGASRDRNRVLSLITVLNQEGKAKGFEQQLDDLEMPVRKPRFSGVCP